MAEDAFKRVELRERAEGFSRAGAYAVPVCLGLLLGIAALVRLWLTRDIPAPWIMMDEVVYSELAKSFASSGEFLIREYPTALFTLYAILVAPAWSWAEVETAYTLTKAANVVLMTLAAVPVFFWARRFVSPGYGLLATALVLAMPAFVYTGMVMTENAFFPAFMLAAFAIALTLERPTLLRLGLVFGAIAIACAVRIQGVVLLAMLPPAILIKVLLDLRADGTVLAVRPFLAALRRYWIPLAAVAVLAVGYLVVQRARGEPLATGLGAYEITGETQYSLSAATRWFLYHLGEIALSVGVLPVSALIVCCGVAARWKGDSTAAERAFLAVAVSSLLVVAQVAVYASQFSFRVEERNMFYVAPLFFMALVLWLDRGLQRPPALTAIAILVPAALLVMIPFETLLNISLVSDSFALIPLFRLTQRLAGGAEEVRLLLGLGLIGAGVLFAVFPRRLAAVLVPASLMVFLLVSSVSVFRAVRFQSVGAGAAPQAADPSWVDHTIGTEPRAAFLYTQEIGPNPHIFWQTEFWNRAVGSVYQVQVEAPGNPGSGSTVDPRTGRVIVTDPRGRFPPQFTVADSDVPIVGDVVTRGGLLTLYRVDPPLRLVEQTGGVHADGWMGADAAYNYYSAPNGKRPQAVSVTVSRASWKGPHVPGVVRVQVGPIAVDAAGLPQIGSPAVVRTWAIRPEETKAFVFAAPRPPFRVEVDVAPTFSPVEYGQADARRLGAQVAFDVLPRTS
jgi:hypothetical protein